MIVTIYNLETGLPSKMLQGDQDFITQNYNPLTEGAIEGNYLYGYYIDLVTLTPVENTVVEQSSPPPLTEVIYNKTQQLIAERDSRLYVSVPITVDGTTTNTYFADDATQNYLMGWSLGYYGTGPLESWGSQEGLIVYNDTTTFNAFTTNDDFLRAYLAATKERTRGVYTTFFEYVQAINALEDIDLVDQYDITSNWGSYTTFNWSTTTNSGSWS